MYKYVYMQLSMFKVYFGYLNNIVILFLAC